MLITKAYSSGPMTLPNSEHYYTKMDHIDQWHCGNQGSQHLSCWHHNKVLDVLVYPVAKLMQNLLVGTHHLNSKQLLLHLLLMSFIVSHNFSDISQFTDLFTVLSFLHEISFHNAIATKCQQMPCSCGAIHCRFLASLPQWKSQKSSSSTRDHILTVSRGTNGKTIKCKQAISAFLFIASIIQWRHTYDKPGYDIGLYLSADSFLSWQL